MTQEMKVKVIAFYQKCGSLKEKKIIITECISTNRDNFDRHFTTYSKLVFILIDFGVRFSGNRATFRGENQYYEIGGDLIIKLENLVEEEFEIIEKYSEKVFRRTTIKFLD